VILLNGEKHSEGHLSAKPLRRVTGWSRWLRRDFVKVGLEGTVKRRFSGCCSRKIWLHTALHLPFVNMT